MFEIDYNDAGEIRIVGRLDASSCEAAADFFKDVGQPSVVNLEKLEYISSAGLGVLLAAQHRLTTESGSGLRLIKLTKHVSDVFRIAGFDRVFEIEYGE